MAVVVTKFILPSFGNFLKKSSGIMSKKCRSLFRKVLGEVVSGRVRVGDIKLGRFG